MFLMVMVLDDIGHLNEVLAAWSAVGVQGVTILESTGMNRMLTRTEARPMFMGFGQLFAGAEGGHHTLFAVIKSEALAEAAVVATEKVIGPLSQPNTGILFTMPVSRVWGLGSGEAL